MIRALSNFVVFESSAVTAVYVIAAIVGIAASMLAVFLFFRHHQFGRPSIELIFGWGEPPKDVPRKLRKEPVSVFVIAPKRATSKPLVAFLFFSLKNSGREAIKNVRISFEYSEKFLVRNELFGKLAAFPPSIVAELSTPETATVLQAALSKNEIQKLLEQRTVGVFDNRGQVSWEMPVVRPGEGVVLYDLLLLPGSGPEGIEKLGFGRGGFSHIVAQLRQIKALRDYFVINAFAFAENHEKLNLKISVLRFSSEAESEDGMKEFHKALWLGNLPKPGLYFTEPFSHWIRHKLGSVGRPGPELFRAKLGLMRFSTVAEMKADDRRFVVEVLERSESQYFEFRSPNYDYFNLPEDVDSFDSLMNWLGLPVRPTLPPLMRRGTKKD